MAAKARRGAADVNSKRKKNQQLNRNETGQIKHIKGDKMTGRF